MVSIISMISSACIVPITAGAQYLYSLDWYWPLLFTGNIASAPPLDHMETVPGYNPELLRGGLWAI